MHPRRRGAPRRRRGRPVLLAALLAASLAAAAPPGGSAARQGTAASGQLPASLYTAAPSNWSPCEGSSNWHSGAMRVFTSAATPWVGPNRRDRGRVLNFTGEAGRTWWLLASLRVLQGQAGRMLNMHDVAGDTRWGGISPWAVDFYGLGASWEGQDGLVLTLEPESEGARRHHFSIVPAKEFRYGERYDLVIRVVLGRRDASDRSARGATTIWVNGSSAPAVDVQNVHTVHDGQNWVQFWQGTYVSESQSLREVGKLELAAVRFGRTLQEALRDGTAAQPISDLGPVGCQRVYRQGAGGTNLGDSTSSSLGTWDTSSFRLPALLGGGEAAPAPAPVPPPQNGSAGRGSGSAGGDAAAAVAELLAAGGVVWDGQLFRSAFALRRHLTASTIGWTSFLRRYPAVAAAFELPSVRWGGKRFHTQEGLRLALRAAGKDVRAWVRTHRQAWAGLGAAGGGGHSRTIAAVETGPGRVVWHDRIFLRPDALRGHLKLSGLAWQRFLETHANVVRAFALPSLTWDGRRFYTQAAFRDWLARRGKSYGAWAAAHADLAARLPG